MTLDQMKRVRVPHGYRCRLVLINHGGSRATDEVVARYNGCISLVYLTELRGGVSQAKNLALSKSDAEWVVFTDDDVLPGEGWLEAYASAFSRVPSGCFFGGPVRSLFEGAPPSAEILKNHHTPYSVRGLNYGSQARKLKRYEHFIGPNWASRREDLNRIGGFNQDLGFNSSRSKVFAVEEADLMYRLVDCDIQGWYLPEAWVKHRVPEQKKSLVHILGRIRSSAFAGEAVLERPFLRVYPEFRLVIYASESIVRFLIIWVLSRLQISCISHRLRQAYLTGRILGLLELLKRRSFERLS